MTKSYHAKVSFDLGNAPRREYRRVVDVISSTLLKRSDTASALLFGSENDRRIDVLIDVESGSSSSAQSKVDTLVRRVIYAIDPNSGVRSTSRSAANKAVTVEKELTAA